VYASAFSAETWKELLERAELQKTDCQEMLNRVHRYLHSASATIQLPVAEAMITYKEKRCAHVVLLHTEHILILLPILTAEDFYDFFSVCPGES
jgi:hypothetical protein